MDLGKETLRIVKPMTALTLITRPWFTEQKSVVFSNSSKVNVYYFHEFIN